MEKDRIYCDGAAAFASQDNLLVDQLRLENLWLRTRLDELSKARREPGEARGRRRHKAARIDEDALSS